MRMCIHVERTQKHSLQNASLKSKLFPEKDHQFENCQPNQYL